MKQALWLALAGLILVAFAASPAQAQQSIPALGSGSDCWWGGVWTTKSFPNGAPIMGCVSTDPTAASQCWVNVQAPTFTTPIFTNAACGNTSPPRTPGVYCGTGGMLPDDYECPALPAPRCISDSPSQVSDRATNQNCTIPCSTGYRDAGGNCVAPPPKPVKKDPFVANCDPCMEQPTGMAKSIAGMSAPYIYPMQVSLNISDIPVGYQPSVGSGAFIRLSYNQKDTGQLVAALETAFHYYNVGSRWTLNTLSFVTDDPASPGTNLTRYVSGGGYLDYTINALAYNSSTGAFAPERASKGTLYRIPATGAATSYELRFPSGTKHVYSLPDGNAAWPRRMFLTQIVDPQGNALTLNYDGTFRLTTLTDATGRNTTFSYTNADPLKVTRITDPFGRHADLTYDGSGNLASITDVLGIVSSFGYSTAYGGYLSSLTTPYGTTNFNYYETADSYVLGTLNYQSMEQTDPLGQTKRVMFRDQSSLADTPTPVPTGVSIVANFSHNNSFVWDEHQYPLAITKDGSGNVTAEDTGKAQLLHWLKTLSGAVADVPGAIKSPLENAVYLNYQGQSDKARVGSYTVPTAIGRVLDNATSQTTLATYNALGKPLSVKDPTGNRITTYTYAANNIDLLTVTQGGIALATFSNYNSQHLPQTYKDAASKVWSYAYNAAGQVIYVTDPLNETKFWEYDSLGRIIRVTVPTAVAFASVVYGTTNTGVAAAASYTYDAYDRVRTATDAAGYVLTYDYDALDHVTRITYPDTTHDDRDYTFQSGVNSGQPSLDLRKATDRLGRITTYAYDADRRLTSVTEPLTSSTMRTTSYSYYENGALKDQTDANGNVTHYVIDIQSRPVSKTYAYSTAAATTETAAYEATTSRLKTLTDALSQVKTITYDVADLPTAIAYTATVNPTPNVSFVWDTAFRRPTSMTDGIGTTNFTYIAGLTNGALKLATIHNTSFSAAFDTITNTYDAMGRLSSRAISGGNESVTYDVLGRPATHTTGLGTFTYGYLGNTGQIASRSLNGTSISTAWGYDTNTNDRRLTSITNSGVTRSYGLSYLIAGGGGTSSPYDIQGITDTAVATHPWLTQTHGFTYDYADRLLTANQTTPGNNAYGYDKLDNATTATIPGSGTVNPTYNGNNQLATWGANTYTYDADGNTLSGDGLKTYKWDAENRLIEIDYVGGTNKTVFGYDGLGRRITQAETVSGVTTTTRNLWCGERVCQTRTSADVVTRRHYAEGEHNITTGQKLVYMQDQLGSVRDVVDATTGALVAAYDYGAYGNVTRSWGTANTDYRYARLLYHANSALFLSRTRAFDPATGRWLSRDSMREWAGANLYSYVGAQPTMYVDPSGRFGLPGFFFGIGAGGAAGYYAGGWWGAVVGAGVGGIVGIAAPWASAAAGGGAVGAIAFAGTTAGGAFAATIITNMANNLEWSEDLLRNTAIAFSVPLVFSMEAWGVIGLGEEESFNAEFARNFLAFISTGWGMALDMATRPQHEAPKPPSKPKLPSRGSCPGDWNFPGVTAPV